MRFFIVLITLTLISLSVSAKSIDQKKEELKKVYESGGITKTEYKKAMEFLEKPKKNKENEKKVFSLKKKKNKTNLFNKENKNEEEITLKKIDELGTPIKFDKSYYPESMQAKFKGYINSFSGQGKVAGQFLFKQFNKSKSYQQKNPGKLIKAMAMYEVFYASQLWDAKEKIKRYKKNEYPNNIFSRKKEDEKKIRSLFGMKKGQLSMREALGLTGDTPTKETIKKFWLLGEFLDLGQGVENEKLSKDLKKRQELLANYKQQISKLKNKLKEDEENEDGENEKSVE